MTERDEFIRLARAYLYEAAQRRVSETNRDFYWRLLAWAANCRRCAASISAEPKQWGLFA